MTRYVVAAMSLVGAVLLAGTISAQNADDAAKLKKELELLTREMDLLKKENDLLKAEIVQLRAKAKPMPDSKFLGRWKLVNEKGPFSS